MTQKQTVFQYLKNNPWVCGTQFQQAYIPEYRTRINELRKSGYRIAARRCASHKHKGMIQEWGLIPTALSLPPKPLSEAKQFLKDFASKEEKVGTLF